MSQAVSPALGGADGFGPLRQLVLDAVSSPLTRVMYARALDDFFALSAGMCKRVLFYAAFITRRTAMNSTFVAARRFAFSNR